MNPSIRRRALLALGASALAATVPGVASAAATEAASAIRFLGGADGAALLTEGPAATAYIDSLNLREIRARLQAPLDGQDVLAARRTLRRTYAGLVRTFSDEEAAVLRGMVDRLRPALAARAPLYARVPWIFVKLGDAAEGGMPHTRGPAIVLPEAAVAAYVRHDREARAAGTLASATFGSELLLHEKTHVLQRADPARFEPLFTEVFGFVRATPAPTTPWLAEHVVQNPDAPDLSWVYPIGDGSAGGRDGILPAVVLPDVAQPRVPDDFQVVGVAVRRDAAGWHVVEDAGQPRLQPLDRVPGYDARFPFAEEDIHPNEIAAVALAHWILRDVADVDERPRMAALAAWARRALA